MNRRDLLKYLLSTPLATVVDYEKLLWVSGEKTIFLPNAAQTAYINSLNYPAMWGIPYHQFNATTGEWLGFAREVENIIKEIK